MYVVGMNLPTRPPRFIRYRFASARRSAGFIRGHVTELFPARRFPFNLQGNVDSDPVLAALGGDARLRAAIYEVTAKWASSEFCSWEEKIDVHLPFITARDPREIEYFAISADKQGRIWVEDAGAERDRAEYWLSLASLSLDDVNIKDLNCSEGSDFGYDLAEVASWFNAPSHREAAYNPCMRGVSTGVQQALRDVAKLWLQDPQNWQDQATTDAMLVFIAMPLRCGRTRATFVPDVLGSSYGLQLRGLHPYVVRLLELLRSQTGDEGFVEKAARRIVRRVAAHPHRHRRLMQDQALIVEHFLTLASEGNQIRDMLPTDPQAAKRFAGKIIPKFASDLHVKLRRFAPEVASSISAPIVLTNASNGLHDRMMFPESEPFELFENFPAA